MGEIKFIIKSILLTVLLIFAMQTKIGPQTLEDRWDLWVRTSNASHVLQQVASGGVQAVRHASSAISEIVGKALGNNPQVQRASRLSLEFKRNPQVESDKKQ